MVPSFVIFILTSNIRRCNYIFPGSARPSCLRSSSLPSYLQFSSPRRSRTQTRGSVPTKCDCKTKTLEALQLQGFVLVDDTGLEPVTSRTSSGFPWFSKSKNSAFPMVSAIFNNRYDTDRHRSVSYFCRTVPGLFFFPYRICPRAFAMQGELSLLLQAPQKPVSLGSGDEQQRDYI